MYMDEGEACMRENELAIQCENAQYKNARVMTAELDRESKYPVTVFASEFAIVVR